MPDPNTTHAFHARSTKSSLGPDPPWFYPGFGPLASRERSIVSSMVRYILVYKINQGLVPSGTREKKKKKKKKREKRTYSKGIDWQGKSGGR